MEGQLLIIKRHWEAYDEDLLRGTWKVEPEDDSNSLGTPLIEAQIPKDPRSRLEPIADEYHRAAEPSVLAFLTWLLGQDRFQATDEWTAWELVSLEPKGYEPNQAIFEAVIVRNKRRNK